MVPREVRRRYGCAEVPRRVRRKVAGPVESYGRLSELECSTVGPATLVSYIAEVEEFKAWCKSRGLGFATPASWDRHLVSYMNELFHDGDSPQAGRYCLYGLVKLHFNTFENKRTLLPRARECLKGWARRMPGQLRDPCPARCCAAICDELVDSGEHLAGCAVLVQADAYLRPSEVLAVRREDLLPPPPGSTGKYRRWSLVVAPSTGTRVTKTGEQDDTLLLGAAGRNYINGVVSLLHKHTRPKQYLFGNLTLSRYEGLVRQACASLSYQTLKVTPHSFRHTGPSEDRLAEALSSFDIQSRGRWACAASVRRYEKHARLLRQLHKLSPAQLAHADKAHRSAGHKAMAKLRQRSKPRRFEL